MEAYTDMMDYSGKASNEMLEAIRIRGGMENWLKRIEQNSIKPNEIKRITKEVYFLTSKATDVEFLKSMISSNILSKHELEELIEKKFVTSRALIDDRSITSKTIIASIAGIIVSSLICGILWALAIFYLPGLYLILIIPVYIICYFIIRLITKQTRRNPVIFIAAFVATVIAVVLGFYFYSLSDITDIAVS